MRIKVLGADSFGVRSLATYVETSNLRILIDPGVSVCPKRYGRSPHPKELEELATVRASIQSHAGLADAVVITHFHHDHYTSFEDRELDLTNPEVARAVYEDKPVYAKSWQRKLNRAQRQRAVEFARALGRRVVIADHKAFGPLVFSQPVKHGEAESRQGWVIMAAVSDGDGTLVFASDTQLIETEAIDWILEQRPQIVIASGPPIHLRVLPAASKQRAHTSLMRLAEAVPTVVVDHHLLRAENYTEFLSEPRDLARKSGHRILTAAEFMGRPNALLEAKREQLWTQDVPEHAQ